MIRRLLVAALIGLCGCAARHTPAPPPPPKIAGPSFVDLDPGWRVRVVTPILKSGGFVLRGGEQEESGNTITLRAGNDFLGYETAVYAVGKNRRISLAEISVNRDGQLTHPAKSIAPRLRVPRRMRHVRLLYTLRVSDADHNMAVLAAGDGERLGALTRAVQAEPAKACRNTRNAYCEWIPAGVAVRAELPNGKEWIPAR